MKAVYVIPAVLTLFLLSLPVSAEKIEEKPLVISFSPGKIEFNPLHTYTSTEAQIYTAIYEGLVTYDPFTLEPLPGVAEKWDVSSDKKVYIFSLRNNAYYWDGMNITASDFKDSWLKMLSPEENAEYAFLLDIIKGAKQFRTGINKDPDSVSIEVLSKYSLRVTLENPAEHFLKILCHHSFVPIHPGFINRRDWSDLPSAPGNGPYHILEKSEKELKLTKNILYWDAANVEINEICFRFIDDPVETTESFNRNEILWATGNFISSMAENREHIIFNPTFATNYFFFNCRNAPWDKSSFRKAFILSSPLEAVRNKQFLYYPADTLVPRIPRYPDIEGYISQDKEAALKIVGEALKDEKKDIVIKIPENQESMRVAQLLGESWKEFSGGNTDIKITDYGSYYRELKNNDYTLGTISWIGDFPDPLTFLQMWTTDSNLNDSGYSNPEFDKEIEESMTLSGNQRYEYLSRAEKRLIDDAVVIPVSNTPSVNLVNTDILFGWYPNPLDIHPVKYFYYKKNQVNPHLVMN